MLLLVLQELLLLEEPVLLLHQQECLPQLILHRTPCRRRAPTNRLAA
jgi:hypothetical protein